MRRFGQFACFDWSGQAIERPRGIALAIARAGAEAPALVVREQGWSRAAALGWLHERADEQADMMIGFDFSAALPFADAGAYFPGWQPSPPDAKALWALADELCRDEPHLSANAIPSHPELRHHFRRQQTGRTLTG
ncbi:MAG: hypothetical protein HKN78_09565, partial [Sphingomonadaceae bacterium]|nr:hypothetical protein [Sphingomonadaceae bacterium]